MDMVIYSLANKLHDSLHNDERVKTLEALEKELNDSYEVYTLSQKKDEALSDYERFKKIYPLESEELKPFLLNLKKCKEELNNHPLVAKYLKAYSEVRDLYFEVDQILFGDLRGR